MMIADREATKMGSRIEIIMQDVLKDDYTEWSSNGRLYLGECPSINEFRQISKLLNINEQNNRKTEREEQS